MNNSASSRRDKNPGFMNLAIIAGQLLIEWLPYPSFMRWLHPVGLAFAAVNERSATMKTRVILTLCVVFVLGLASSAHAQLVAGSPEDAAYTKIIAENNTDAKVTLLLAYEKQFPQSRVLPDIYVMLMTIYQEKNDTAKANDFGERAIKIDAENITALIAVSRNYSIERKNLDRAVQYAQKAIDVAEKMKAQPPPPNFTPDQWKGYIDSTEQAARSMLAYAKSLAP